MDSVTFRTNDPTRWGTGAGMDLTATLSGFPTKESRRKIRAAKRLTNSLNRRSNIAAKIAASKGENTYKGAPCSHGHVYSGTCIECARLTGRSQKGRDRNRRAYALRAGHAPPPKETDCPPIPKDGLCECCRQETSRFHLDHNHITGAFRGCNNGSGLADDIDRLKQRISFLERTRSV